MLTSRNDDLRWILATIVESGHCQFWGWLRDVFVASMFLAYVEPNLFFAFGRENSPVQPLYMIVTRDATVDPPGEFNIASIPFVCTSLDSYYQAMKSYLGTHTKDKDCESFCSPKEGLCHGQFSFCEAVKVNMSKMNESHNNPKTRN